MSTFRDRRKECRVTMRSVESIFRQCDISLISQSCECDAVIEDISLEGVRLKLDNSQQAVHQGEPVFIRGCIFNDMIGFLSSATCKVVWTKGRHLGLQFDAPLDLDRPTFSAMVERKADTLAGYA